MTKTNSADLNLLVDTIIHGIQEVKGNEIKCMDLREIPSAICEYFVVCHGNSFTQVEAIANKVQEETKKKINQKAWKTEGYGNAQWIILDYFDVVVHVFYKENREQYGLEDLWADAKIKEIEYQA